MSSREGRDSDSRRHRSRFDGEPRGPGKPQTERVVSHANVGDRADQDEKRRRGLQDALPLEALSAPDSSNIESGTANKESDSKNNGHLEVTNSKHSSDPTEVPRSRSYFQTRRACSFPLLLSVAFTVVRSSGMHDTPTARVFLFLDNLLVASTATEIFIEWPKCCIYASLRRSPLSALEYTNQESSTEFSTITAIQI